MKKTVMSFLIVWALICVNLFGIIMVSPVLDLKVSQSNNDIDDIGLETPNLEGEGQYMGSTRGDGDIKYVIITNIAMESELQSLADWKTNRLNIPTEIMTVEWINANYADSELKEKIRHYLKDMYDSQGIEWVLLGGDENVIPVDIYNYDSYYANVTGSVHPDLALGRLPTGNELEMADMVGNILAHQRDLRSWKRNMYLLGTNVFNTGDGYNDLKFTKSNYLDGHNLTYWEDYEIEGNINKQRTVDTYNLGMGTSIFTGHGFEHSWLMDNGTLNFFNVLDVENSLTNDDKRGFVWSACCSTGNISNSITCLAESWLKTSGGGAIGFVGAAEEITYIPSNNLYQSFWRTYDEMLNAGKDPTQGVAFLQAMNADYFHLFNLFGDPQVGLTVIDPELEVFTGYFVSDNFVDQEDFNFDEQVTFKTNIQFPFTTLPEGVHVNWTVQYEGGELYYPDESYEQDPWNLDITIFQNWTIPLGASLGMYNISARLYNLTQGWEFTYENITQFNVTNTVSVVLEPGWNLISIPLIQSNTSLDSVLESIEGEYDIVRSYNSTDVTKHWKQYHISKSPLMNDLNEFDHNIGFWVHITNLTGTILNSTSALPLTPVTITLYQGWNLVGYPSLFKMNRTTALNNLTFGTHVDAIWTYDAATQTWEKLDNPEDLFIVGRGYWIHAKEEYQWEVPL